MTAPGLFMMRPNGLGWKRVPKHAANWIKRCEKMARDEAEESNFGPMWGHRYSSTIKLFGTKKIECEFRMCHDLTIHLATLIFPATGEWGQLKMSQDVPTEDGYCGFYEPASDSE